MIGRARAAQLVVLVALAHAYAAHAEPSLDTARAAIAAASYEDAGVELGRLIRAGRSAPAELAEAYLLTGIVHAAMGEEILALEVFKRALVLGPKLTLPAGVSPKISRPFRAAYGFLETQDALSVEITPHVDPPALSVAIEGDALGMIKQLIVTVVVDGGPAQTITRPAADELTVALPGGRRLDVRVAAVDEHGNRVVERGSKQAPIVIVSSAPPTVSAPIAPPPPPPTRRRPVYARWWLYGGASVAVAAAGTYFAFGVRSAERELEQLKSASLDHSFDEARRVEARGNRDALYANVGFVAAGTLAAIAMVLLLTEPGDADRATTRATVTPVAIPGGGAVVLGTTF